MADLKPIPTDLENGPNEKASEIVLPFKNEPSSEFTPAACLVTLGAFSAMFCSVGFINAFGVFQEFYQQGMLSTKSPSDISWLGSFNIFIMFAGTLPVGIVQDRYGPRVPIGIGSVILLFALFMTSLCSQYWQLFLAQGFLLGVGISCVILPALATVPQYFIRSRGLALGITVSGSSLGGVIWPIILKNVLYGIGFGWGVRIAAFIMLPLLGFAYLAIRLPSERTNHSKVKPDMSTVKNPVLIITAVGLFFVLLGLFSPFFYITSWTISQGYDAGLGFYMVSVINAASLFGRIMPGIMADLIGPFNIMIMSVSISGIICMCWTTATSLGGIVVLSLAYSFSSGAVISLQGMCCAAVVQREQYGVAMGFVMSVMSIAGLIGTPINGQLLGAFSYLGLSLFSGLAMIIGMLIFAVARTKIQSQLVAKA